MVRPLGEYVPKAMLEAIGEERVIGYLVENIAEAARDKWVTLAQQTFKSTRRDYVNAIQPVQMRSPEVAVVTLVGVLPNLLENGMATRDLRDTLLGPNVPVVPRGQRGKHPVWEEATGPSGAQQESGDYYRAIPFRFKAPGSRGFGQSFAKPLEAMMGPKLANRIGRAIYEMAKELAPTRSVYAEHPGPAPARAEMVYGEPKEPQRPFSLQLPPGPLQQIYGGMIREEKDYEKAVGEKAQSQFVTFRTISTRGKPWVHPGLTARKLAPQVMAHTTRIAEQTFAAYAKGTKGE
jgi:hypothetical protein